MKKNKIFTVFVILLFAFPSTVSARNNEYNGYLENDVARGGGGNECYQYVDNIRQTKTYNCGSTTVLQTLYGMGYEDNVPGNTNTEKIQYLDQVYNVDLLGQADVNYMVNALNDNIPGLTTYSKTYISTNVTIVNFEQLIATSLTNGKPVVVVASDTSKLTYYNGNSYGHYLSVDYINRTTDTVRIVDCHFNSAYYGVHYVDLQELYDATCRGWLIY
ncbi:MAG: hypothetical protein ACI4EN_10725 [Butyrivibrio sp.]